MINLLNGDCLEQMKQLDDNSVDSIVTDPPYGISFMAKKWDYDVPSVEVWKEAMRVLKPGGHALIACGTRTQHRMVVNIEDAGFEIRDVVSCEFFTLCRKPLSEKTIAKNVLKWGTGGINIDGCRVEGKPPSVPNPQLGAAKRTYGHGTGEGRNGEMSSATGRFPANLIHDGSQEVLELFPETKPKESAARFFYQPKASKKDRNEGNTHPTVKPTALMAYLCRLITPTGGTVLDPYMGSGSTGKAAVSEGFSFTGIELDPDYYEICKARVRP